MKTLEERLAKLEQDKFQAGYLLPANGGKETPIMVKGYRLLYCYHTGMNSHYYLNLDTDIILTQDEVNKIFA